MSAQEPHDLTLNQARARLFYILAAITGALACGAIIIGVSQLDQNKKIKANESHIQRVEHEVCISREVAIAESNKRAKRLDLVIAAEIAATRKGERTIKTAGGHYTAPPEVAELEKLPPSTPLVPLPCPP